MDFLRLALRAVDPNEYAPFGFDGDFTEEERATISAAFAGRVPAAVDAMVNNWTIFKFSGGGFYARRATWDIGWARASAQEIADAVTEYYSRAA